MADVSYSKAYRNKLLEKISLAKMNDSTMFVATKIAPFVQVTQPTGDIANYGKQAMRLLDNAFAVGGSYKKTKSRVEITEHYRLKKYGLIEKIMQEDVLNAEKPIDAQIDSTAILTEKNMIANEHRIMDAIVNNSVSIPEETLLLARQRDNYASASSDPIKDISVGRQLAYKKSGKMPNKLLISIDVLFILTNHPKIIARFPGTAVITEDTIRQYLAGILGIELLVAGGLYLPENTPTDGDFAYIWNKFAMLMYSENAPTLRSTSFMKTYARSSRALGINNGITVLTYTPSNEKREEEEIHSYVKAHQEIDQVIVDKDCAYIFRAPIA